MDSLTNSMLCDSLTITVYIEFIVDKKGKTKNFKLNKIDCESCNDNEIEHFKNEGIKVIDSMSPWGIGRDSHGRPKKVNYILPIKFTSPNTT